MTKSRPYLRFYSVKAVLIFLVVTTLGCGILDRLPSVRGTDEEANQRLAKSTDSLPLSSGNTSVPISPRKPPFTAPSSTVELRWTAPVIPVDGFVVSYGFENEPLNNRVTVSLSELEREETPEYGAVYRYLLRDIPKDRELKVSIASYRGKNLSEASPPRVVPVNTTVAPPTPPEATSNQLSE